MTRALLALSLVLATALPSSSEAQDFCGLLRRPGAVGMKPLNSTAEAILKDLAEVGGFTTTNIILHSLRDPELKERGAAAQLCNEFQRFIFYDPDFVERIRQQSGNDWPRYFTFAHEVAHHVNGDTLLNRDHDDVELSADRFAAKVLTRRGAKLPQLLLAINALGLNDIPKPGYPTRCTRRVEVIKAYDAVAQEINDLGGRMDRYMPCDCDAVEPGGGLYAIADMAARAPIAASAVRRCGLPEIGRDLPIDMSRDLSGMCAAVALRAGDRLTWQRIGVCSLMRW